MTDLLTRLLALAELAVEAALEYDYGDPEDRYIWRELQELKPLMAAALAQPEPGASQLSDGYHTFAELYEHRHALCLALMRAMPQHWWFSRRHADGELCFGGNDWFIVGAELPGLDDPSVTYHLPMRLWDVAQATGAQELPKGRPWDGHTAQDVVDRFMLWAALAQPEPVGATDEELLMTYQHAVSAKVESIIRSAGTYAGMDDLAAATLAGLHAVLQRCGRPAIEPVPEALDGANHIKQED